MRTLGSYKNLRLASAFGIVTFVDGGYGDGDEKGGIKSVSAPVAASIKMTDNTALAICRDGHKN